MTIEDSRSLLVKSHEEIEAGEALLEDVTDLEEKALIAGNHSKTAFGAGFRYLKSYFTCMDHIPLATERIELSMDYVDNKCSEAVDFGKSALEELDTGYNGFVTFIGATGEAKEKAGHTNPTSVLNHVIKAIGHYSQIGTVETLFWGRQLNLNFEHGFRHAQELASNFILAHEVTHEKPAVLLGFIPRLEQAVRVLEQSKGKPADQISVILDSAANLVKKDDAGIVIDAATDLIMGVHTLESSQDTRRSLKRELVLARANINNLLKEI